MNELVAAKGQTFVKLSEVKKSTLIDIPTILLLHFYYFTSTNLLWFHFSITSIWYLVPSHNIVHCCKNNEWKWRGVFNKKIHLFCWHWLYFNAVECLMKGGICSLDTTVLLKFKKKCGPESAIIHMGVYIPQLIAFFA